VRLGTITIAVLAGGLLLASAGPAAAQVIANAGPDIFIECADLDGTDVTMDGSGSSPEGTYLWQAREVVFDDPTSVSPTGTFLPGETLVKLTVTLAGESATDTVLVTIGDDTPPTARARAFPRLLWPPNHDLHEISVRVWTGDRCSEAETVELLSAESNEPDNGLGDGDTENDIQDAEIGTDDRFLLLRSERAGLGSGRVYTLTYRVVDSAGNVTYPVARVRVPHDESDFERLKREHPHPLPPEDLTDVCPTPLQAAREWAAVLPDPRDFATMGSCLGACSSWYSPCLQVSSTAYGCASVEKSGSYTLDLSTCYGRADYTEMYQCILDAQAAFYSGNLSSELTNAHKACTRHFYDCNDDCRRGTY
jgi:hypothetical protein